MNPYMKGIDVSHWQGTINFNAVKNSGFDFVIIKAGGSDAGQYKDEMFERYYKDAKSAGLHVGAYYFTGKNFYTVENAVKDANHFIGLLKGKQFDMPVYVDVESVSASKGKNRITDAVIAFCDALEFAGYFVGIYASDISGFRDRMYIDRISDYTLWVARYNKDGPQYVGAYGMWQYGGSINYLSNTKVNGVSSTACDQDFCYEDFPNIIVKNGFNGYASQIPESDECSNPNDKANWDTDNMRFIVTASRGDQLALKDFCASLQLPVENYNEV